MRLVWIELQPELPFVLNYEANCGTFQFDYSAIQEHQLHHHLAEHQMLSGFPLPSYEGPLLVEVLHSDLPEELNPHTKDSHCLIITNSPGI